MRPEQERSVARGGWKSAPAADSRAAEWAQIAPIEPASGPQDIKESLGSYRLVEEIGEGGMGVVHLALDRRGRAVAIKVLRAHVAHDDEARQRLGREVETLSRIRDDRVASVIDADVMGLRPYIVTRYVPGPTLDEVVDDEGPFDPDDLLRLARGMAEAIRSIHACGVVHRDIKPGNVLLEDGEPVLIDFGIAHLQDDVRHTIGGLVMGTPGYLSPELVEGAAITDATDWWGWAATITYAASGRPPFGRGRMDAVLSRVRSGEVDLDGVDPRLVPLLRAALSPRPSERPQADAVLAALEAYAAGHSATVPTPTGAVWDQPGLHHDVPPTNSTQTLPPRGTKVMPAAEFEPQRWDPPAGRPVSPVAPQRNSAAYGQSGYGDDGRDGYPVEDVDDYEWDDEPLVVGASEREGDPRIGLAMRTTLMASFAALWLGAVAAWPGFAIVGLALWSTAARAVDRSMTGLVVRRFDHGRRRSDVPWAVALGPWHVVVGALATVVSLLLPALVAAAGVFASAFIAAGLSGGSLDPGSPVSLIFGAGSGLIVLWWGPGGASIRRGSRSIVRKVVPEGHANAITTGILVALGVLLAVLAIRHGESFNWWPLSGNPFG